MPAEQILRCFVALQAAEDPLHLEIRKQSARVVLHVQGHLPTPGDPERRKGNSLFKADAHLIPFQPHVLAQEITEHVREVAHQLLPQAVRRLHFGTWATSTAGNVEERTPRRMRSCHNTRTSSVRSLQTRASTVMRGPGRPSAVRARMWKDACRLHSIHVRALRLTLSLHTA